ncbi:esterase FE4-like isoform X2 [Choristoneura fumiferana]
MQPYEAVNNKIVCPQIFSPMFDLSSYNMQEDCLVANVYMPDTEETNLSVLVYVHGGAYQIGWGEMLLPHSLVKTKKIVAVTFNYRLGAHGFLCLGTEGAPGNAGMKDQVALLRWVNKNIAKFGGSPNDVTITGSSSGSSAVDLLMLSKMPNGLYHRVIPVSGANVGVWSIQHDPIQVAKDYAVKLNFTEKDDVFALEFFYQTIPFPILLSDNFATKKDSSIGFVPCVERNITDETFFEDTPVNILKQGNYRKVPVLYGFANMDGLMMIRYFSLWKDEMNDNFAKFLPLDLVFKSDEEQKEVAQIIKEFYFGDNPISEDSVQGFIDYYTDTMFTYPHLRSTQLQVAAGNDAIYLYEYSFFSPHFQIERMPMPEFLSKIHGANHGAPTAAVYDMNVKITDDSSENYLKMREKMRELWLNFITTGKPVPEGSKLPAWPPVGANRSPHMDLGEEIKLKGPLLEKRARFWDDIYERYYRMPVPPPKYSVKSEL